MIKIINMKKNQQNFLAKMNEMLKIMKKTKESTEITIKKGSPIPPILWLIYVKHLHPEIKLKFKRNSMNYINDVIIYVNGKNVKENCKLLIKIAKSLFD